MFELKAGVFAWVILVVITGYITQTCSILALPTSSIVGWGIIVGSLLALPTIGTTQAIKKFDPLGFAWVITILSILIAGAELFALFAYGFVAELGDKSWFLFLASAITCNIVTLFIWERIGFRYLR